MKKGNSIVGAGLGFSLVCALPALLPIRGRELIYTNSIAVFLLWILLTILMTRILERGFCGERRKWLLPGIFALLFSLAMAFGAGLEQDGSVPFRELRLWAGIAALSVNGALIVRSVWDLLLERTAQEPDCGEEKKGGMRSFFLTAAVIFVCYLPVFLAVYPGFFVYDAQDELMQVVTRNFSTHHPLLHVLLLGGTIQLVHKLGGSYNLGIALYTLLQMAVLSCIYAWGIERLKREGAGRGFRVLSVFYFGLFPVLVMFSLCSAKDGLFTGMLFMMVLLLRSLIRDPGRFLKSRMDVFLFALSSLLMMLFRHNGFYAFAVFSLGLFLFDRAAEFVSERKKLLLLFAGIFACFLLVNQALALALHADDSENQELLTVPIQQMARVYGMEGDTLSQEEKDTLYEILPEEALRRYTPKVSDGVKVDFDNEAYRRNPSRYLKLWIKIGIRHPFAYLNAWFMTSYGFWYPDAVIDVYRGNSVFTFTYGDSSYFGYEVEEPGRRESKIPVLNELYRRMSLEIAQQRIPVLSMLFSPGFLFWFSAFLIGLLWYGGRGGRAAVYMLPALVWLTVILGPTYLVRYVVFLWALVPVLLFDAGFGRKINFLITDV